jgi:hypothetical protein
MTCRKICIRRKTGIVFLYGFSFEEVMLRPILASFAGVRLRMPRNTCVRVECPLLLLDFNPEVIKLPNIQFHENTVMNIE